MTEQIITVSLGNQSVPVAVSRVTGAAPGLVYLPGLGCTKKDAAALFADPALVGRAQLAFDYPGYGGSALTDPPFSFDGLAALTHALLEETKMRPAVVIAHSAAASIAVALAEAHPASVAGVVLLDGTFALPADAFDRRASALSAEAYWTDVVVPLMAALRTSGEPAKIRYAETLESRVSPVAHHAFTWSLVETVDRAPLLARFLALPQPKRFLFGARRPPAAEVAAALDAGGCTVREIPASGHFLMIDNPEACAREIAAFIAS